MLEPIRPSRADRVGARLDRTDASSERPLFGSRREGLAIVNLRGDPADSAFVVGSGRALGHALPIENCRSAASSELRIVWAGPDDWFVIASPGQQDGIAARLRAVLAGLHHAVTDVSSGYTVLQLAGPSAREVLAHGCPLDLHPRAFSEGQCAGSHFFKASIWLWQADSAPTFELLVRRSFVSYVELMLYKVSREHPLVAKRLVS